MDIFDKFSNFAISHFFPPKKIYVFKNTEVYKDTIEGYDLQKYGQEVRKAIRLSRMRVMRSKGRQKINMERAKVKRFNYFHYE